MIKVLKCVVQVVHEDNRVNSRNTSLLSLDSNSVCEGYFVVVDKQPLHYVEHHQQ